MSARAAEKAEAAAMQTLKAAAAHGLAPNSTADSVDAMTAAADVVLDLRSVSKDRFVRHAERMKLLKSLDESDESLDESDESLDG